ncbi:MAG: leucyl/phenylalanyl-tRNA--protein transferase, partial [Bacteroidaceae bacterium]|nr:leucyl/phenylalanyl-tRNA--protein transferase [Bacteroidaceae bacterium]
GVLSGSVFCGESMFSKTPSASKLALITLAQRLQRISQKTLIDCQFETPHLRSMGGRHISYAEYMDIMNTNNT